MSLTKYKTKRNFGETPEPEDKVKSSKTKLVFVVQRHQASHLHYDFRLEMEGVLKSWAVPKGPSLNPKDKRLAMMVEDHPYDYRTFEGKIPEGNYGAGVVEIWDEGTYEHIEINDRKKGEAQLLNDLEKGSVKIVMHGKKLKGEFALVKLKGNYGSKPENSWLLIKHDDQYAVHEAYSSEDFTDPDSEVTEEVEKRASKDKKKAPAVAEKSKANYKTELAKLGKEKKYSEFIPAMLAKIGEDPFDDKDWLFEVKWDGYRAVAEVTNGKVKLYSRKGLSFENKYPDVVAALEADFKGQSCVLDGEIVVLDKEAKPSFQLLQHFPEIPEGSVLMYYVFDLLRLEDKELYDLPLLERKSFLKKLLPEESVVRYCEHVETKGTDFFNWVTGKNLEGMIAKKADSLYYPGKRTSEWRKIRNHNTQETIICGYTAPGGSRKHFGSLVLGIYEGKKLLYAGNVGTGFDDLSLQELFTKMEPLEQEKSPFGTKVDAGSDVTWLRPELVCNIKYTEWTEDAHLRHPVFMGLRIDKKAAEVIRDNDKIATVKPSEEEKKTKETKKPAGKEKTATLAPKKKGGTAGSIVFPEKDGEVKVDGHILKLTNQNKIYFPEDQVTKGDVVKYYQLVAEYILPYLKDRPESLRRNPNGINEFGFFHKDAGDDAPEWVQSIELYSDSAHKDIDYLLCNDRATLMYINNLGCIEINPWNSRVGSLDNPDYMIMDLDPSEKNTFEQVIETALVVKEVLDKAGAEAYCKTSGATGLHIYVPLGAKYTYDQCKDFGHVIGQFVQEQLSFTTLERPLNKRKGRIYLDYLQNRQGQTLSSVYSLRPKKGASVSTPLEWSEVKSGLKPTDFTIFNILDRIKDKGDLFKGVMGRGIDLLKCLENLQS